MIHDFRADLHCHTTCSDGSLSPAEIVRLAKSIGLQGLSITDHDTIAAYSTAMPAAKEAGLELISGVELSSILNGISTHILGYAFDLNNPAIVEFCRAHRKRRQTRSRAILEKLSAHGMPISEEEITKYTRQDGIIGRPHIAKIMLDKGYVPDLQAAFKLHIGEGMPCYEPGSNFTVQETIDVIHEAKGLAFIAHPHLINSAENVNQLLQMNFDGLEGYYSRVTAVQNERWIKAAAKRGWIVTGGSDFHGDFRPNVPLGCSWTPEETFRQLQAHFQNLSK